VNDAALAAKFKAILANTNAEERAKAVLGLQNGELAEKMYYVPLVTGSGPTIVAYQPYMRNVLEYNSTIPSGEIEGSANVPYWWTDKA